jgi:hypothetical protein
MNRPLFFMALVFWLANALLHLEFSNWIGAPLSTPFGQLRPRDLATEFGLMVGAALGLLLAQRAARALRTASAVEYLPEACVLLCWILLAVASRQWLVTTDIELIHYLQYALVSLLLAAALDPGRERWPLLSLLLLSLLLSVADELNQYLYLTASYGSYLDFNDFWLNQLGSLLGLILYYLFLKPSPRVSEPRPLLAGLVLSYLLLAAMLGLALLSGAIQLAPEFAVEPGGLAEVDGRWVLFFQREPGLFASWQASFSGGRYYVLGPLQGVTLLVLSTVGAVGCRRWLGNRQAL